MKIRMPGRCRRPVNLLELRPKRNARWEALEDGRAVLYVPRFRSQWLRSWLVPMLANPDFRVRLDALGTSFWKHCDGTAAVSEIAERMGGEFGCDAGSLWERIAGFIARLEREELIVWTVPDRDRI